MLANTYYGVQDVTLIDSLTLQLLADWLCHDEQYHDRFRSQIAEDAFQAELKQWDHNLHHPKEGIP